MTDTARTVIGYLAVILVPLGVAVLSQFIW